jgi:hypothetical protein
MRGNCAKPVRVVYARRALSFHRHRMAAYLRAAGRYGGVPALLISWEYFRYVICATYFMMFRCGLAISAATRCCRTMAAFWIAGNRAWRVCQYCQRSCPSSAAQRGGPQWRLRRYDRAVVATVHTTFALHYAHDYYRGAKPGGLQFPSGDKNDPADYWDFVYFSFVIGMTAQVSDVGITDKTIRRTATAHGIVSFVFNTALVALMVNIAASAI